MDPNENIKAQMVAADRINVLRDRLDSVDSELREWSDADDDRDELQRLAGELAELVVALDEWRRSGGYDPYTHGEGGA